HFALTGDGHSLVTASVEGELCWWNLHSRRTLRTVRIAKGYHALALSPDGGTVAVGIAHGLQLVDVRTHRIRTARVGLAGSRNDVALSPDGKTVVSTTEDGTVTVWDVASERPRETLRGHSNSVTQSVFSRDGRTLYTASSDGSAIAWDLTGGRRVGRP